MKKILKLFTVTLMILGSLTYASDIQAEEINPLNAQTRIKINVKNQEEGTNPDDVIIGGEGEGGTEGEDDLGLGGSENNNNFGNALLGIWRVPKPMSFVGNYAVEKGYSLNLNDEDEPTRSIVIADTRSNQNDWKLSAQLSELKHDSNSDEDTINSGYRMKMNSKYQTYRINEENKLYAINNDYTKLNNVVIGTEETKIVNSDTVNGGKGYTGIIFDEIELNFDAGVANPGNYSGFVEWTLSDTIN